MTYLICKVGQGHIFLLSPMLMSYGAMGHLIVASGCGAGAPNIRTDVRPSRCTDVRTHVRMYGGLHYIPHFDYRRLGIIRCIME